MSTRCTHYFLTAATALRFVLILGCALLPITFAHAESITLVPFQRIVADSSDYFTEVTGTPRTFNSPCDIGDDNFSYAPKVTDNSIWSGTNPSIMGPTAAIVPIPQTGALVPYQEDCHRLGLHHPINADRFRVLSYRAKLSSRNTTAVRWSKDRNFAVNGAAWQADSFSFSGQTFTAPANEWAIMQFNLPQISLETFPWSGQVTGLSIVPNVYLPPGSTTNFDWIRLIDPESSKTIPISWTSSSLNSPQTSSVTLYVDENAAGYQGTPLAFGLAPSGSYSLQSGILPPGTYYFYAAISELRSSTPTPRTFSRYVGPLVINGRPYVRFISPTRTSGTAYSADVRGDAWDMEQESDISNFSLPPGANQSLARGFHSPKIENGKFVAESDPAGPSHSVDPHLLLAVNPARPIDSNRFRYFCHRSQLDTSMINRSGDLAALNRAGLFSRFIYANSSTGLFGSTAAHEMIERSTQFGGGLVTYCIDLWDPASHESGVPWRSIGSADVARFDPHESESPRKFALDFAELYEENRSRNSAFTIRWENFDPEGDLLTTRIYADVDATGFDGTLVAEVAAAKPGLRSYVLQTNSLPNGRYYLYLEIGDGQNVTRQYTEVPVLVASPRSQRTPCDFDGDQRSDFAVLRPDYSTRSVQWFLRSSTNSAAKSIFWGDPLSDLFLDIDSNGDEISDWLAVRKGENLQWLIQTSTTLSTAVQPWGITRDIPLATRFAGGAQDERTVFRSSNGTWFSVLPSGDISVQQWGLPGDIPTPADYDGDGKTDLAIWRPASGHWAIAYSSTQFANDNLSTEFRQWGLSGDQPMGGDYSGDGKADLVVWRPSDGSWYICPSESSFHCEQGARVQQFGLPGDFPIHADTDGDGIFDPSVYRPSNGMWFTLESSTQQIVQTQWGLPGDLPMCHSTYWTMLFS